MTGTVLSHNQAQCKQENRQSCNLKPLFLNGDKLALFQNLVITYYLKVVFGSVKVVAKFDCYRKWLREDMIYPMTIKKILELVNRGNGDLISGTMRNVSSQIS